MGVSSRPQDFGCSRLARTAPVPFQEKLVPRVIIRNMSGHAHGYGCSCAPSASIASYADVFARRQARISCVEPVSFHQNLLPRVIIKDVTRGVGEGEGHPEVAFGCQCGTLQVVGNQSNLLVALSLRREAARCIQCRSRLRGNFTGERCVDTPSLINTYAHRSLSSVNCFGR